MKKYKNKYRIPSARLQSWDYGDNAAYFITICTTKRIHFFGNIVVVETPKLGVSTTTTVNQTIKFTVNLNPIGEIAHKYWMEIPNHFPFVQLGNFVVMPNHTHGILIIDKKPGIDPSPVAGKNEKWKPQTNGVFINQYKRIVTINSRKINSDFGWQSRFHDHIIRDDESFRRIQKYIADNPLHWGREKFNGYERNGKRAID